MTTTRIDRTDLLEALRAHAVQELAALTESQRETLAGAVHEESRPENDKDTRAIESSYLARGLADRVEALQEAVGRLEALRLREFGPDAAAAMSAVVVLLDEDDDLHSTYFLAPAAGGTRLQVEGREVQVVTPASPMGRALVGTRIDDDVELSTARGKRLWSVVDVY